MKASIRVNLELEYAKKLPEARAGDPAAMRRVASILETFDREAEALVWWKLAHDAGSVTRNPRRGGT